MITVSANAIEIARDGAVAKFARRAGRWNALAAFVVTLLEAIATLLLLRFVWRVVRRGLSRLVGGRREAAA